MDISPDDVQVDAAPQVAAAPMSPQPQSPSPTSSLSATDAISADDVQSDADTYGGASQTFKAGLEGAGRGLLGPVAPMIEERMLGVKPKDMLGREEEHPIAQGVGEAASLVGGALTGVGVGGIMSKFGEAAGAATKLGEAGSYVARVGSSIASQAAEMAVLQGSNETAKMIMNDPNTSSESAIANIGLAAAMGGATGAFITGAVSPLWSATIGPKIEQGLTALNDAVNGGNMKPPEAVMGAFKELGMEPSSVIKASLSGDPKMQEVARNLYRAKHVGFMNELESLPEAAQKAVGESLGMPLEDITHYSKADAGTEARETFLSEMQEKYGPIAEKLEQRDELAKQIDVSDEERRSFANRIMEKAVSKDGVGTDSPYYKIYSDYAQRILAQDNVAGLDRLKTELFNINSMDRNAKNAHMNIRSLINDFQEQQISKISGQLGKDMADINPTEIIRLNEQAKLGSAGAKLAERENARAQAETQRSIANGKQIGAGVINERAEVNRQYAEYRKMMDELTTHTGLGNFKGTGTLKAKLSAKLSPEDFLAKFSPKGNSEAIPFLQQNFPSTAKKVQEMETKNFLSPHIKSDMGGLAINYKTLNNSVEKGMKGSPEYMDYVLPNGSLQKIQSAKIINDAMSGVTGIKDSGTAGNLGKVFDHIGAGAAGATAWIAGTNPISGMIAGEMAQRLTKDVPEAIKLALLKHMGTDKPVSGSGFKAAVDFIHNTIKGQNALGNATKAVFKSGAQVLASSQMPNQADRDKLDKIVSNAQNNPDKEMNSVTNGKTGHYFPDHQAALTENVVKQTTYLASLKPQPTRPSPLDREIPPTSDKLARYNRALDIATNPLVVLNHLKEGTLQATDLQDLKQLYPSYYNNVAQKLANEMQNTHSDEDAIPYQTRMGLSLLLGQAVDSSMQPSSIQAAQPQPKPSPGQGPAQGAGGKSVKSLGKSAKMAQTPTQTAESDRSDRRK